MTAVHLEMLGPIALLRLDNPLKMNALTPSMLVSIDTHFDALDRDKTVRCIILTAEGNRAFCTGADINAWGDLKPAEFARRWVRDGHRTFDKIARISKPTIAALCGHAFGGGLELATACDIRIIAPAALLALPETGVGIVPGWSGTQRLMRLLPEPIVKEMALFGRKLSAERAMTLGFVSEVSDDPIAAARGIAERLLSTSAQATEVTKYIIHAAVGEDTAAMIETLAGGMISSSADKQEGVAAFRAKRKPEFPGA